MHAYIMKHKYIENKTKSMVRNVGETNKLSTIVIYVETKNENLR
jgi:hypothetical protein